jgi:probable rRNA maturation factor
VVAVSWSRAARKHLGDGAADQAKPATPAHLNRALRRTITSALLWAPPRGAAAAVPALQAVEVSVCVVDDNSIHLLNHDYRKRNRATDVLSFSLLESGDEPHVSWPNLALAADAGSVREPLALGDLVISIETAQRQACEQRHSLEREMMFLAAHGTLHLWGYDHAQASARRTMFQMQDAIVDFLLSGTPLRGETAR